MDNPELMRPLEAAAYLKISRRMLDKVKSLGQITHIKIGGAVRFRKSDLDAFLSRKTKLASE